MNRISNLDIKHIGLVKVPAVPDAKELLSKSLNNNEVLMINEFIAKNLELGQVYYYPLVPDKTDLQGDMISKEEIQKTVQKFNQNLADGTTDGNGIAKEHHGFDSSMGAQFLSMYDEAGAISKSVGVPDDKVIKGAWLMGIQLTQKGIDSHKAGDFTGVSIGGKADRTTEKSMDESTLMDRVAKSMEIFIEKMKDAFTVEKADVPPDITKALGDLPAIVGKMVKDEVATLEQTLEKKIEKKYETKLTAMTEAMEEMKKSVEAFGAGRQGSAQTQEKHIIKSGFADAASFFDTRSA